MGEVIFLEAVVKLLLSKLLGLEASEGYYWHGGRIMPEKRLLEDSATV